MSGLEPEPSAKHIYTFIVPYLSQKVNKKLY